MAKAIAIVTKQLIIDRLTHRDRRFRELFVGRALVVIFNNQTRGEQSSNNTTDLNGIGFTGSDGKAGALTAKYFIKHNALLDWQLDKWATNNRLVKYHRQLDVAAQAKAARAAIKQMSLV
jgi:hypothetical protein